MSAVDSPTQVVLLAGGYGTRISEETSTRPKPMIEIGGRPILWHLMKIYAAHGLTDFIICLGYKGYAIKEFFANYFLHSSNVTINLRNNQMKIHDSQSEPWQITMIDTGEGTLTGGRLKRIGPYLTPNQPFCLSYGDGLADIDITQLMAFARTQGTLATVTAVQPPGRFGSLAIQENRAVAFQEKPQGDGGWINGGFFVLQPEVLERIEGDSTSWEQGPLEELARDGQLAVFQHRGFWMALDTLRDKVALEEHWNSGQAPWKIW